MSPAASERARRGATATARGQRGGGAAAIRVLVADDHAIVREGIRALLKVPGVEVVGEAASGAEALRLAHDLRPDVVLTDVRMPGMDGLQASAALRRELPDTAVVILTNYEDEGYLASALDNGAAGFVLKGASRELIVSSIRSAVEGAAVIDARLLRGVLAGRGARSSRLAELTKRERETLALVAKGYTNPEIAEQLGFSVGTIKLVVHQLTAKLGVRDRVRAAVLAAQSGLVEPGEPESGAGEPPAEG